jgi:hypothetical protein
MRSQAARLIASQRIVHLDAVLTPSANRLDIVDATSSNIGLESWSWVLKLNGVAVDNPETTEDCSFTGLPAGTYTLEQTVTDQFDDEHFREYTDIVIDAAAVDTPTVSIGTVTVLTIPLTFSAADAALVERRQLYYTSDGSTPDENDAFVIYSDDTLTADFVASGTGTWKFRLQDIGVVGLASDSALSAVASTTISAGGTEPDEATNLVATAVTSHRIDLTWDNGAVGGQINVHRVADSTDVNFVPDENTLLQGELSSSTESYSDLSCAPDTDYAYKIETINAAGQAFSDGATDTTPVQGAWPDNRPPGLTTLLHLDGSSKFFAGGSWTAKWSTGLSSVDPQLQRVRVVADAASKNGNTILAESYIGDGPGFQGQANCHDLPGADVDTFYISTTFQLSDNYEFHPSNEKIIMFGPHGGSFDSKFYINVRGRTVGIRAQTGNAPMGAGIFEPFDANAFRLTPGVRNTVEIIITAQSAPGVADGSAVMYLNDVLCDDWVHVSEAGHIGPLVGQEWWGATATRYQFGGLQMWGYWGGTGGVKTVNDSVRIDEVIVAGA